VLRIVPNLMFIVVPGNAGTTMGRYDFPSSRHVPPELCKFISPNEEGAGNAGAYAAPAVSYARKRKVARTSIQVQRKHSGIPCAMV
jgi:hypothetical protein